MSKKRILIQLDTDRHPSSFDAVVAVDAGVDQLLQYGDVEAESVEGLVHGAIFTRGGDDLARTAITIGGSDAAKADELAARVRNTFFGPMQVSVLVDSNGCNTTAAAAVLAAAREIDLAKSRITVLGGTGPVGLRVARLLCRKGAAVQLASRSKERGETAAEQIRSRVDGAALSVVVTSDESATSQALEGVDAVIACGAAGVQFLSASAFEAAGHLSLAIDLNAVPPVGIESIKPTDKGRKTDQDTVVYGAIGVGGTKMKIHKRAIAQLFERNDQFLDAEEVLAIGEEL